MSKHRKPTIVSRTVNTVRTSTNAVKAGAMKLKFWGRKAEQPVADEAQQLSELIESIPLSQWVPAMMTLHADGSASFTTTDDNGIERHTYAEPVTRTAGEQLAADIVDETLREMVSALTDSMVANLKDAAEQIRLTPITVKPFTTELFAAEDIAGLVAPVPPAAPKQPGLLTRGARKARKGARKAVEVATFRKARKAVREAPRPEASMAAEIDGLTEFRAIAHPREGVAAGWVAIYAVDKKAAKAIAAANAAYIASETLTVGEHTMTVSAGSFLKSQWSRYPLGQRGVLFGRPSGVVAA